MLIAELFKKIIGTIIKQTRNQKQLCDHEISLITGLDIIAPVIQKSFKISDTEFDLFIRE